MIKQIEDEIFTLVNKIRLRLTYTLFGRDEINFGPDLNGSLSLKDC